jgi:hypothetical protein
MRKSSRGRPGIPTNCLPCELLCTLRGRVCFDLSPVLLRFVGTCAEFALQLSNEKNPVLILNWVLYLILNNDSTKLSGYGRVCLGSTRHL